MISIFNSNAANARATSFVFTQKYLVYEQTCNQLIVQQIIQESLHTFVKASLLGCLINPIPMFNKINPNPVR